MIDADDDIPMLDFRERIEFLALAWFYLANAKWRRTLQSGNEDRIRAWATRIGVTDEAPILACQRVLAAQPLAFRAVAGEIADSTCPEIPCWDFLRLDAMQEILECMREAIHPREGEKM